MNTGRMICNLRLEPVQGVDRIPVLIKHARIPIRRKDYLFEGERREKRMPWTLYKTN